MVGRRVELVFDPFDLTNIEVRWLNRPMGKAVPMVIGRHSHPAARPDPARLAPPASSGIDYLALVEARADAELARRISYAGLVPVPEAEPSQLSLFEAGDPAGSGSEEPGSEEPGEQIPRGASR